MMSEEYLLRKWEECNEERLKLRTALEFYSLRGNYEYIWDDTKTTLGTNVNRDNGNIARTALGEKVIANNPYNPLNSDKPDSDKLDQFFEHIKLIEPFNPNIANLLTDDYRIKYESYKAMQPNKDMK